MIEYIKGSVDDLQPTLVIIEAYGVGYGLAISLNTYTALQGKKEAKLFVYEAIREDAYQLFGFATRAEREWFMQLISVSGIGGQTARMVLSAFTPSELTTIVQTDDVRALKSVKGIGPKAAQRIIVDLKDKVVLLEGASSSTSSATSTGLNAAIKEVADEAVAALAMLGFAPAAAHKVVSQIAKENPEGVVVEQIIKEALKRL